MRAVLLAFVLLLPQLAGCASSGHGLPAALCNTPGRKALSQSITERGGKVLCEGMQWDDSVEAPTKEQMGPALSDVIMPQNRFSDQEVQQAKAIFPEARVIAPPTMEDFEDDPDQYLDHPSGIPLNLPNEQ